MVVSETDHLTGALSDQVAVRLPSPGLARHHRCADLRGLYGSQGSGVRAAVGIIGLGLVIALVAGLAGASSCYTKRGTQAEHQAAIHLGEANAHASQAKASDAAVEDLKAKLEASKADLGRLTLERGALLRKLAAAKQDGRDQAVPVAGHKAPVAPVSVDLQVIAKDAEVIEAQAKVIKGYEAEVVTLTASRDQWKAAFEAERKRATGLEIALDAQKHVASSGKWAGRLQGLAIGLGAGFVAGRLR